MHAAIRWAALGGIATLTQACTTQPLVTWKMIPGFGMEPWAPQDLATNVQDWDRAAHKIVEGLEANGLVADRSSGTGSPKAAAAPANTFFLRLHGDSVFLLQLKGALESEITSRGGATSDSPAGAYTLDLRVDVVRWGSRLSSQPYTARREAVWQASLISDNRRIVLSFREPFYIKDSDIALYERASPPDETLANMARPLRYRTQ